MKLKRILKKMLGIDKPTNDVSWFLRISGKKSFTRFDLIRLTSFIPGMMADVRKFSKTAQPGKKVFLFASMHSWIKHLVVTGLALRGLGHTITLGYLPYGEFAKPVSDLDLHRNDLHARAILRKLDPLITIVPFLDQLPTLPLPERLLKSVEQITTFDARYILQREDINGTEDIFLLRQERNINAASRALTYFQKNRPDVVIVPNGMIQEYGAVYETARYLDIPVVTYEFGEQSKRIWIGQDRWVIHHIIDKLWANRKDRQLNREQKEWLENFLAGRQKLEVGTQFSHLWQNVNRSGGEKIRHQLNLDDRPVALLPTNVLGDSATLGLSLFTQSMSGWLQEILPYLANKTGIQVLIRIHPAESKTIGPSVMEIVQKVLPEIPSHIHLVGPTARINTYDLMDITDLGLVYTTTAGLEMALRGIPVSVSGNAHYRKKGFTLDSDSWEEYFQVLDKAIKSMPSRLTNDQLEIAWNYGYTFFAEYPKPFPWHLESIWRNVEKYPISTVLSPPGREEFFATFQELVGISTQDTYSK